MGYNSNYKGEEVEALLDKADSLNVQAVDTSETLDDVETNTYVKYVAQTLTEEQKAQARENIGVSEIGGNVDLDNIGFVSGTGTDSALQKGSDERGCEASGDYSIAGGEWAKATGEASVALGRGCEASGRGAIALGGVLEPFYVTGKAGSTTYTANSYINEYFVGNAIVVSGDYTNKVATILSVSGSQFTVDKSLSANSDLENYKFNIIGCNAQGISSVALGGSFKSIGTNSSSEGRLTVAAGVSSHAEGTGSVASGDYSHSEGMSTIAEGAASHAEGSYIIAKGSRSHAEGNGGLNIYFTGNNKIYTIEIGTNIQNSFSFIKGIVGKSIINSKNAIIATVLSSEIADDGYTISVTLDTDLGELKKARHSILYGGAYGDHSHSENISIANGESSHAQGEVSIANGDGSFIHGSHSVVDGEASAVFGTNNYAQNESEFALGTSNHSHTGETPAEQTLFSVGCGDWQTMGMDVRIANQIPLPTPEDGTNALEVMRNGDVWLGNYNEGTKIYDGENKEANVYAKSEVDTKINSKQDKASRNLIINSNFDNGGTISDNSPWKYVALGGSGTKDNIVIGGYNGYNVANLKYVVYGQPVTLEAGKTYTLSCVYLSPSSNAISYLDFNHMLGEMNIISSSNVTTGSLGTMLNAANGYQKAHITFSVSQTSERTLAIGNTDASSNINSGLFITCIQLEEGDTATEYKRAEETYVTTSILKDALNKPILKAPYDDIIAGFVGDNVMKHGVIYVSQPDNVGTTITIENFEAPDKDVVEYVWHFKTGTMPTLSLPSYIYWANGELPEIEDNTVYELSITATRHYSTYDYIYKAVLVPFKTI